MWVAAVIVEGQIGREGEAVLYCGDVFYPYNILWKTIPTSGASYDFANSYNIVNIVMR